MLATGWGQCTALYIPGLQKGVLHFKAGEEELRSLDTFFLACPDFRNTIYTQKHVRVGRLLIPETACIQEQPVPPRELALFPSWDVCPRKNSGSGLSLWPGKESMPKTDMSSNRGQKEQTVTQELGKYLPQAGESRNSLSVW